MTSSWPVTLRLPYPPSVNRMWRSVNGRNILSREARAYKQLAAFEAMQQGASPLDGPVSLDVTVFRPQRRGDLDNALKGLLDAARGILFHDDAQVVEISAKRRDAADFGGKAGAIILAAPYANTDQAIAGLATSRLAAGRKLRKGGK